MNQTYELTPEDAAALEEFKEFIHSIPTRIFEFVIGAVVAVLILVIGFKLAKFVCKLIKKAMKRRNVDEAVVSFVDTSVSIALKALCIFAAALSIGFQAASVTALLGSCAIAISLAVQGSLSNFAGGILILLLKPFVLGDFIVDTATGQEGMVRNISIFYTKIEDIYGNIIVLPNGALANTTMINRTNGGDVRSVRVPFSIAYKEDIKAARAAVAKGLEENSTYLLDASKIIITVKELADSGVVFEAKLPVNKNDFYHARSETLEIIKYSLDAANISIPFPQVDVHFDKETE